MLGRLLGVTWPGRNEESDERHHCIVVGSLLYNNETLHRVYYMESRSVETLNLANRNWSFLSRSDFGWAQQSLLGSRLVIHWKGEFENRLLQTIAIEKYGRRGVKCPYEAFVIDKLPERENYLVFYPYDDILEEQRLSGYAEKAGDWQVLDDTKVDTIHGLPLVRWANTLDTTKLVDVDILTRAKRYVPNKLNRFV